MNKSTVIGIGAGGHAKVVIEILRAKGGYKIVGILDSDIALKGTEVLSVPILGGDDLLPDLVRNDVRLAFVGVGSAADARPRRRIYEMIISAGMEPADAIHPSATISPSVHIAKGTTVMPGVIINSSTTIGNNSVINSGAIIEHDCSIGNHAYVASGAVLSSGVTVGECAHIGAGAVVRQGISIGAESVVGAGAAVVNDIPSGVVVVGVPARILKQVEHSNTLGRSHRE